jgi:hypothetical protein
MPDGSLIDMSPVSPDEPRITLISPLRRREGGSGAPVRSYPSITVIE